MDKIEIASVIAEFGEGYVRESYSPQDLKDGDITFVRMALRGRAPAGKIGGMSEGRAVDKSHKVFEDMEEKYLKSPVNLGREQRSLDKQQASYDKQFGHNKAVAEDARRKRKVRGGTVTGERFELAGQISRDALLEEFRTTGKSVGEITKDPEHMERLAKKTGWLLED